MQLQFWEFQCVLALVKHQTSCKCRDARRHQQQQQQRMHQKRHQQQQRQHQKGEVSPRRVLVSVQETSNFPISANSVTILKKNKRNGDLLFLISKSFSISPLKLCKLRCTKECDNTWCAWQLSTKATVSQFQSNLTCASLAQAIQSNLT